MSCDILHFCAENSRLTVKRHCNGLKIEKWVDKETVLSNNNLKTKWMTGKIK